MTAPVVLPAGEQHKTLDTVRLLYDRFLDAGLDRGSVVIAVGGAWGTLSEIALARAVGRRVILLGSWSVTAPEGKEYDGLLRALPPAEAVRLALDAIG